MPEGAIEQTRVFQFDEVHVCLPDIPIKFTHSLEQYREWMSLCGYDERRKTYHDATTTMVEGVEQACFFVWMDGALEEGTVNEAGLLAHEAVHVAKNYLEIIGEVEPTEELLAYVVQSVFIYLFKKHMDYKEGGVEEYDDDIPEDMDGAHLER